MRIFTAAQIDWKGNDALKSFRNLLTEIRLHKQLADESESIKKAQKKSKSELENLIKFIMEKLSKMTKKHNVILIQK